MRLFYLSLLLASLSWSSCSAPSAEDPPIAASAAEAGRPAAAGVVSDGTPGPDPAHRPVQPADILHTDTVYAATLPVLDEPHGAVRLRLTLNPRTHSVETLRVLFAPQMPRVSYQQLGQGVSRYDAPTGRYYFLTAYQKIAPLPDGRLYNGQLQEIDGWVHPELGAAVALKGEFAEE